MRQHGGRVWEWKWLFALAALSPAWPNPARAADADLSTRRPATLTQEVVGFELTPASMAMSSDATRFQAGPGGSLRFFRHRWEHLYLIPFQAGLYIVPRSATAVAHIQIEGGVIVPGTARRLELGVGVGTGVIMLTPSDRCDEQHCTFAGGIGWMVSVAARYRLVDRADFTSGVGVRAIFPSESPTPISGGIALLAFDFAFGRPDHPVDDRGQRGEAAPAPADRERVGDGHAQPGGAVLD